MYCWSFSQPWLPTHVSKREHPFPWHSMEIFPWRSAKRMFLWYSIVLGVVNIMPNSYYKRRYQILIWVGHTVYIEMNIKGVPKLTLFMTLLFFLWTGASRFSDRLQQKRFANSKEVQLGRKVTIIWNVFLWYKRQAQYSWPPCIK